MSCPECDGSGKCPQCAGDGEYHPDIIDAIGGPVGAMIDALTPGEPGDYLPDECPHCDGSGKCPSCGGSGRGDDDDE
jgi:hypothetical protein